MKYYICTCRTQEPRKRRHPHNQQLLFLQNQSRHFHDQRRHFPGHQRRHLNIWVELNNFLGCDWLKQLVVQHHW